MSPIDAVRHSAWSAGDTRDGLRVAEGARAFFLLENGSFISAWERLERDCAWSTAFQRAAFARCWYQAYAGIATPLLLFRGDESTELRAILPLAAFDNGRRITVVGAEQSEYQGWLALAGEEDFITSALDRVRSDYPATSLRFQYLPPGTPLDRLDAHPDWSGRVIRGTEIRGLIRLDPAETAKTLRKSGNRSKMNRLRQFGELRLDRLTTRSELEAVIDVIGAHCDLRQCAMNGVMPFADDLRKRDFHLRMMDQPGLLHASVLKVGDVVAAAHLGAASSLEVALGVIAHSPFLAAHSPGKLLIHFLSDRLAAEGYSFFDLTPGGGYKDRFASEYQTVQIREIYFHQRDRHRVQWKRSTRIHVKQMVLRLGNMAGMDEGRVREAVNRLATAPQRFLHRLGAGRASRPIRSLPSHESTLFRAEARRVAELAGSPEFAVDSVDHLAMYRPDAASGCPRQDFCRMAIEHLESGAHTYSVVEDGRLIHVGWMSEDGTRFGLQERIVASSAILHDDYTHVSWRGRGLQRRSIAQRARDAHARGLTWLYCLAPSRDVAWQANLERMGFERVPSKPVPVSGSPSES